MAEETQVLVRFVTKLPAEFKVPEAPVAVPSTLKRYGLSQIINHLLALDPARPFDFLINGELIRKTLEQQLLDHGLSAESTLEVEYVPAVVPPKQKQSTPHDDWVSSIDASMQGALLSGSYDGALRVWDDALTCTSSFKAHGDGVNAVVRLPTQQGNLVLTAGKDHKAKLWQLPDQGLLDAADGQPSCTLVATYTGHTDAVEALAVNPAGTRFCSCGWDGRLNIWETGRAVVEAASASSQAAETSNKASKKRKIAAGAETGAVPQGGIPIAEASAQLQGHMHCVASVSWPTEDQVYSGGWDHSVRRWDVETTINTDTYNGSKAICSVASCSDNSSVVAFGGSDRALRIWDIRSRQGEALNVKAYSSHANWITGVAWCPGSSHHIATSSHDHTVKMWDVRTSVPLGSLSHHSDKVLCVAWAGTSQLLSGGADCQLKLYEVEKDF